MAKIAQTLTDLVGHTPLLQLNRFAEANGLNANIIAKIEYFNPLGSVKDRIAKAMVEDAEKAGKLKPGSVIVEPTSGNTGIGLAFVAAAKGYRLIIAMPDTMTVERRNMLAALGAELVLTPGSEGMKGAVRKAEEIAAETPNSFIPGQFVNPANPQVHYDVTGAELLNDTDGKVDVFIAGVGTGGTVSGVGKLLKEKIPSVKIFAVEPNDSPVLSGGTPGAHRIQGIGAGFVPATYNAEVVDEVIRVKNEDAFANMREVAKSEGLLVGVSSGAVLWAAAQVAKRAEFAGKNIVVLLPDTGERYLSMS